MKLTNEQCAEIVRRAGDGERCSALAIEFGVRDAHVRRIVNGAQRATPHPSPIERFLAKVDKNGEPPAHRPELGPCWLWTAAKTKRGYGKFGLRTGGWVLAHVFSWEVANDVVPEGLQLDHLCRVTGCVNPLHLEPVTQCENARRASVAVRTDRCIRGHDIGPGGDVYIWNGWRWCRECSRIRERAERAARKAAA